MLKYLESNLFFKSFLLVLRVFMSFTGFTVLIRKIHIFRPNISLIVFLTRNYLMYRLHTLSLEIGV
ncbi:unnamed protein product [Brassica oleracea var. botrytis]|uniref:(rape) hypothetical protein n=1 Tax=Brassica napus TaxID=3708 RepID=A0A816J9I4_BRANA|nr:unnamed protein product [Brassica napus]